MKNLVIMAGGKSSRMGRDKVFLKFGDKTFIEHLFLNAGEYFDNVFISTDNSEHAAKIKNLDALKNLPDENIIIDAYPRCGPIGGICSVFDKTDLLKFSVIPTDVPRADVRALSVMFDFCHDKPCIFRRDNGNIEPLIGAYERGCYDAFRACLDRGENSIHKALESNGFKTFSAKELVEADPSLDVIDFKKDFFNVNFPGDYETLTEE